MIPEFGQAVQGRLRSVGLNWAQQYTSARIRLSAARPIPDSTPILIVDDDRAHATSTQALLEAHNHSARIETNPVAALEWLRTHSVAVLLLDLNMPEMSGVSVLEELVSQGARMKSIVVSGEQEVETVSPLLRLGVYDFMSKPYQPDQLVRSVTHALAEWHLEQDNQRAIERERRTDELNRFLLDAFPDLLYVLNDEGNFTFINKRLGNLFPENRDALIGRSWQELFAGQPGLKAQLEHRIDERRRGLRATRSLEIDVESASGERAILECTARGLYQDATDEDSTRFIGTYGVLQDVTESRSTRRALQQSQRKFHGLFMESPDAVFISDLESGEVLEGNDSFNQLKLAFGASASSTDQWLWATQEARGDFARALRRAPEHLSISVNRTVAGNEYYLEINARPLELEQRLCMLATVRDRTRERSAELHQRELQSQLQQAGKMEALGQLAGGVAHDFNNILASIIGFAELVMNSRSRLKPAQVDEYLGEVITAGQRARDLISQMLTFTRANLTEAHPVQLTGVFDSVASMLRAAIPSTIEIVRDFEADLPEVQLDPVQFQQVVMNLMINARDAIEGTGRIELKAARSTECPDCHVCGGRISEPHVKLTITDTGHGIPKHVLPQIFEMYYTTREPGQGTGIGLWLVADVVHKAGGHISVETGPEGTEFAVHLPLVAPEPVLPEARPAPADSRQEGRIVVVDDEISVSSFLGEILRHEGFETVVFNESPKAMDFLVTHLDEVALLLTDQNMPMLTGLDLAQFVKGRAPNLPVVLITGFMEDSDKARIEEFGVEALLPKPFTIEQLLDVITTTTNLEPESRAEEA